MKGRTMAPHHQRGERRHRGFRKLQQHGGIQDEVSAVELVCEAEFLKWRCYRKARSPFQSTRPPPLPLTYRVVAERAHAQPDLAQVEHVLQAGRLAQVDPMGDVLAQHVGRHKVVYVAGLQAGRGSEGEGELHRWGNANEA